MNDNNYQRKGATSNSAVGKDFELKAQKYFKDKRNIELERSYRLDIGLAGNKPKKRRFDLGSKDAKRIVECKSHTWTAGNNVPSAKMTTWNLEMYYFHLAPHDYKCIFFCKKDFNTKRQETLANYYIKTYSHLIPSNVAIWEYCEETDDVKVLK